MIRTITRPTSARCTLPMYIGFLLGEPKYGSCRRLAEVMDISHDSATRFLQRERYEGKDLYNESAPLPDLKGGTLSVDDSVLDKPYSQYLAFVGYFWSGKHHRSVKGINLITLYYSDTDGQHLPVNFRVYDLCPRGYKSEGKTKNDYFREMLEDVLAWGLESAFVTGDSWYSGVDNLKRVKKHRLGWLFAVESNRTVSVDKGRWVQVKKLDIPDDGLAVWLKDFGNVKLFRTWLKDQPRHYLCPAGTPFAWRMKDGLRPLTGKRSLSNMTSTGILNSTTAPSSRPAISSVSRCAPKPPSKTTCSPPFAVMPSSRSSAPCH